MFEQADVIHSYTRAQALADGVLVDAGDMAKEAGFKVPVALTSAVHEGCVVWTEVDEAAKGGSGQSERGRLWDVLWLACQSARRIDGSIARFSVYRVPREGVGVDPEKVDLVLTVHPGDRGEPVCTIMDDGED